MSTRSNWAAISLVCVFASGVHAEGLQLNVGGLPLEIAGKDAQTQQQIDQAVAPVVKKLDAVLVELMQLNQRGELKQPSAQLLELLTLCTQWQKRTQNKFSCRLGGLEKDWQAAAAAGELPDRAALRKKARRHLQLQWTADQKSVRFSDQAKTEGLQLDLQGLWQGWVIEQLTPVVKTQNDLSLTYGNLSVRFGAGSNELIKLQGVEPVAVSLSKEQTLAVVDRAQHLRKVGHHSLSQTLVPEEGWPVEYPPSLLVRAGNAIEAGVMSNALLAVPGYQALADANRNTGVEVLTITETGKFFASQEWYAKNSDEKNPWPDGRKFKVDFDIPELNVAEYRRPYIAIWISDATGQPVQSLLVAGDGSRWLRELRQWWRKLGRGDDSLVDATAGATRKPGRYHVEWDGRDLQGKKVVSGKYVLQVEVAREHGGHESLTLPFELNGQAITLEQQGKQELGAVALTLR